MHRLETAQNSLLLGPRPSLANCSRQAQTCGTRQMPRTNLANGSQKLSTPFPSQPRKRSGSTPKAFGVNLARCLRKVQRFKHRNAECWSISARWSSLVSECSEIEQTNNADKLVRPPSPGSSNAQRKDAALAWQKAGNSRRLPSRVPVEP